MMERKEVSFIDAVASGRGHNPTSPNILERDDYIFILHISRDCHILLHSRNVLTVNDVIYTG